MAMVNNIPVIPKHVYDYGYTYCKRRLIQFQLEKHIKANTDIMSLVRPHLRYASTNMRFFLGVFVRFLKPLPRTGA